MVTLVLHLDVLVGGVVGTFCMGGGGGGGEGGGGGGGGGEDCGCSEGIKKTFDIRVCI